MMEKKKREKNKNDLIIRTCVITRANDKKENLLRFVEMPNGEYIFDKEQKIQHRGIYIKNDLDVFQKLFNKYKINLESANKALEYIKKTSFKKSNDEIVLNILESLKNSEYLIYGIDENIEAVKNNRVKLLIIPSDVNSKQINRMKKVAKAVEVKVIFIEKQYSLKKIFLSEVKTIGITTKKVVNGILNKLEVEK